MIPTPIPPATDPVAPSGGSPRAPAPPFIPPGSLPPLDAYDGSRHNLVTGRYISEHLLELAGMQVAWAFDGSFLFAAPTAGELFAALENAGIGRDCYVTDYIDPPPRVIVPALPERRAS